MKDPENDVSLLFSGIIGHRCSFPSPPSIFASLTVSKDSCLNAFTVNAIPSRSSSRDDPTSFACALFFSFRPLAAKEIEFLRREKFKMLLKTVSKIR